MFFNRPGGGGGSAVIDNESIANTLFVANQAARLALVEGDADGEVSLGDTVRQTDNGIWYKLVSTDPSQASSWQVDSGVRPISQGGTGLGSLGTAGQLMFVNSGATALEYRGITASDLPNHSAALLTSGTLDAARLPNHSAALLTSGTLPAARYTSSPTTNRVLKYDGTVMADSSISDASGDVTLNSSCLLFAGSTAVPTSSEFGVGCNPSLGLYYQAPATLLHRFYDGSDEILRIGGGGSDPLVLGPQGKLNLSSTYIKFTTTAAPASTEFGVGHNSSFGMHYQTPSTLLHRFYDGSTEVCRIGGGSGFAAFGSGFTPAAPLHARSTTGKQFRIDYDEDSYADFTVNSSSNLTIAPSGGSIILDVQTCLLGPRTASGRWLMANNVGSASGALPANRAEICSGGDADTSLAIVPENGWGTPGNKVVMGFFDGSTWRSALEYAHASSLANGKIDLMREGGKFAVFGAAGSAQVAYNASPSATDVRDILIAFGFMAAS